MFLRAPFGVVVIGAQPQVRAERAYRIELRSRRRLRRVHGERYPSCRGGERESPPVIPGGRGNDRLGARVAPLDGIRCATELVRERRLEHFELQQDFAARQIAQPRRPAQRRPENSTLNALCGVLNVGERDQGLAVLSESRMSASWVANADRAMTSSAPAALAAWISPVCTCDTNASVRIPASAGSFLISAIVETGSPLSVFRSKMTSDGLFDRASAGTSAAERTNVRST